MFMQLNRTSMPAWGGFPQHTVTKWLNPPVGPPKAYYKKNVIIGSAKKVLDPALNNRFLNATSWLTEQWK